MLVPTQEELEDQIREELCTRMRASMYPDGIFQQKIGMTAMSGPCEPSICTP
jgi:hypothetical protein